MKNKQHEYIVRAFLESKVPSVVKTKAPELVMLDAVLGGYCTQLIKGKTSIKLLSDSIISSDEKKLFSNLISEREGNEKKELVMYYRMALIVEEVLLQYKQSFDK